MRARLVRTVSLVIFLVLATAVASAQEPFDVAHFAGSPGGPGRADGIGRESRFQQPSDLWGDGTYLYVIDHGVRAIRRIRIATGEVEPFAEADSGLLLPQGLWGDGTYLYVADRLASVVRIDLVTREVTTLGSFVSGGLRDLATVTDGPLSEATFRGPMDVWGDGRFLYVSDRGGQGAQLPPPAAPILDDPARLRRIDLEAATVSTIPIGLEGYVWTGSLWGSGSELLIGFSEPLWDSSIGAVTVLNLETGEFRRLGIPAGLRVVGANSENSTYYFTSDSAVFALDAATGDVELLAGSERYVGWVDGPAAEARFRNPWGIWGDGARLFVAERDNYTIRVIDLETREVTTLAGAAVRTSGDTGRQGTIAGVDWSDGTDLYYTDADSVRRVSIATGLSTLVAGSPVPNDRASDSEWLNQPSHVWGNATDLYVTDRGNAVIRRVSRATGEITTLAGESGSRANVDGPAATARFGGLEAIWGNSTHLYVADSRTIRRVSLETGEVETVAGNPLQSGTVDGIGLEVRMSAPRGFWGDDEFLYFADEFDHVVRRMNLTTYEVVTLAGQADVPGWADGPGSSALFFRPLGVWGDGEHLYVSDGWNRVLRRISLVTSQVTTIAGTPGQDRMLDGVGTLARFALPSTLWGVDGALYVEDDEHSRRRVRRVDLQTMEVTTLGRERPSAGDGIGLDATFDHPSGIWGDDTYLYVTESSGHVLRRIDRTTRQVATMAGLTGVAGTDDGAGSDARFNSPRGICSDGTALYVADSGNHTIRRIHMDDWAVETFAGNPETAGTDDGPLALATFDTPSGLWCDATTILVADYTGRRLRLIDLAQEEVTTLVGFERPQSVWFNGRAIYFLGQTLTKLDVWSWKLSTFATYGGRTPNSYGSLWGDSRYLYAPVGNGILRVDLATDEIELIAGVQWSSRVTGTEDGTGTTARFNSPEGVWGDGTTLYVADSENHAIRTIGIGDPPLTEFTFEVPPSGSVSRSADDHASDLQVGHGRIESDDTSVVDAIAILSAFARGVLVSEASIPAVTPMLGGRVLAQADASTRIGLAIQNPHPEPVTVSYYFTDPDGQNFSNGVLNLEPNGQAAAFLDEATFWRVFPPSPFTPDGNREPRTFTFNASMPVAAVALEGRVNERGEFLMAPLPVADLAEPTTEAGLIPYFVEGGGWQTTIALVNTGNSDQSGALEFYDSSGVLIDAEPYSIPARGAVRYSRASESPELMSGSVRIVPGPDSTAPSGSGVFSLTTAGVRVTETGFPAIQPASTFRLYVETSSALQFGFALTNAEAESLSVDFEVIASDGRSPGVSGTLEIPPRGQQIVSLGELPGGEALPESFKGVLRATARAGLAFSIGGLRTRFNARGDYLITATTPHTTAPGASTRFLPHFVEGGGFTTEIILLGDEATTESGRVRLSSPSGDSLAVRIR